VKKAHLLIVEDDFDLAKITKIHLCAAGYTADNAYTCEQAESMLQSSNYDCILMDVMLPDGRGNEFIVKVRNSGVNSPVIFMSCLDDPGNIIKSLQGGGDDYIVKPVDFNIMCARIEAQIRRAGMRNFPPKKQEEPLREFNSFIIDTLRHRIIKDEKEISLSQTEYQLLLYMSERADNLLLYNDLYEHVWKGDSYGDIRTVMVHISNIRKKIDPSNRGIIETVRGAGYIFCNV